MKLRFRFRITLAILIVAYVCVLGAVLLNYYDSKQMLEQNYIQSLDEKMSIQAEKFDETMQVMYQTVRHISHEPELTEQIHTYLNGERSYSDGVKMSQVLNQLLTFDDLGSTLYLYLPQCDQVFSSMEYYAVRDAKDGDALSWLEEMENPFTPISCINRFARSSERVYAYPHPIYDTDGSELGILCITADERLMYYALLDSMNREDTVLYRILLPDGMICSAKNISEIGEWTEGLEEQQKNRMNAAVGAGNILFVSVEAPFTRYRMQCQSDLNHLTDTLRSRMYALIEVSLVVFLFLLVFAVELSVRLSRPLEELVQAMDQVGSGDFSARVRSQTDDEMETLREHFNTMVSRMDELMEQVVHERTQKKQAELNALQYQIRPHFMYNTLNSIRFAATLQRNQKLAELLGAFIALLEASIQRQGAFIPLREEIKLVQDYMSLKAFRYFDCFETVYDIAPETEDCYVPCLLLQPMVENAVFHGVDTQKNDNRIVITAWLENDILCVSIQDNGEGMPEKISEETSASDRRRLTGIGLKNVRQRLQLYYGDLAEFTISSTPGQGTTVLFRLPASHDPDVYKL